MSPKIIKNLPTVQHLRSLQGDNKGCIILKFGAEWCSPCKRIEPVFYHYIGQLPENVTVCINDVDEAGEIYMFMKSKRMANGIPCFMAFFAGNTGYIPDEILVGADPAEMKTFMDKCYQASKEAK